MCLLAAHPIQIKSKLQVMSAYERNMHLCVYASAAQGNEHLCVVQRRQGVESSDSIYSGKNTM